MIRKFSAVFLLLLFSFQAFAYSRTYIYYTGTIGKFPIEMTVWTSDSINDMGGFYHYTNQRGMLELAGTYNANGDFSMNEMLNDGNEYPPPVTGTFSGKFLKSVSLDGNWKNKDGTKIFPFHLVKTLKGGVELKEGRARTDTAFTIQNGDTMFTQLCDISFLKINSANASVKKRINNSIFLYNDPNYQILPDSTELRYFPHYNLLARDYTIHSMKEICEMIQGDDTTSISSNQNSWQWESTTKLIWNGSGVLCLDYHCESYTGGERPFYEDRFCCYNLATGDTLRLKQFFLSGYKKDLLKAIARHISNDGPEEMDDEQVPITNNFSITPFGINFHYNEYELGAYATGGGDAFIPWSELNVWIDPKGPMAWVRK